MKFLFITSDNYPPFRVDVSILFGKEMVGRGHTIDWILQSSDSCDQSYITKMDGSKVFVGKTDNGNSRFSRLRKNTLNIVNDLLLFGQLKNNGYDFIQVKDKFISAIFAIIAAKIYKTKFIYWLSFPFPEASIYQARTGVARYPIFYLIRGIFFKKILYKLIMPLSDHIFVQSEQMKYDVAEEGIRQNKLTAVPMGVSLNDIPYIEPALNNKSTGKSIVYLGTLARERRIDFLVRVLNIVKQDIEDVTLHLVGDGEDLEDRNVILNEAEKYGINSSVRITGFLDRGKAFEYVRTSSVCVSPFYPIPILNSTSPTKLVEYMAMGKPVVVNDHPEQKKLVEETGCGICVKYSEQEFADAIIKILKNLSYWSEKGINGRRYVEEHRSYQKIADRVEQRYLEILATTVK